jgi:hypothetical protein
MRNVPAESPEATLKPFGAKRATVVVAVWPVYSLHSSGLSIDRTKIDFPDYNFALVLVAGEATDEAVTN